MLLYMLEDIIFMADILAVPLFLLLIYYFLLKKIGTSLKIYY